MGFDFIANNPLAPGWTYDREGPAGQFSVNTSGGLWLLALIGKSLDVGDTLSDDECVELGRFVSEVEYEQIPSNFSSEAVMHKMVQRFALFLASSGGITVSG